MFSLLLVNIVIAPAFNRIETLILATCNQRSFTNSLITRLFTDQARLVNKPRRSKAISVFFVIMPRAVNACAINHVTRR